jgi:hypothetical protein
MSHRRTFRLRALPVGLAVVLMLMAMMAGSIWHVHRGNSGTNCQICHLGNQPVDQQLAVSGVAVPVPLGAAPKPVEVLPSAGPSFRQTVSRAPPQA